MLFLRDSASEDLEDKWNTAKIMLVLDGTQGNVSLKKDGDKLKGETLDVVEDEHMRNMSNRTDIAIILDEIDTKTKMITKNYDVPDIENKINPSIIRNEFHHLSEKNLTHLKIANVSPKIKYKKLSKEIQYIPFL